MKTITANCIAIGHLHYGKLTLELNEADYEEFYKADKSEQKGLVTRVFCLLNWLTGNLTK